MRLFFSMLLLVASHAQAESITLRADNWCPFNCDPKSTEPGYMIEIAKAALEPAHKVEYETLNWARAIAETRQGAFVGIVGAAKSDAEDFVFPANALGNAKNCFWVKPDSKWEYKDPSSLDQVVVGVIKDYSYDEEKFDPYVKTHAKDPKRIDIVAGDNPLELNVKKLQMGRIGALIEEESVIKNYLFRAKLPADSLKSAGCIKESELFVAFGPKNPKAQEYAKLVSDKVEAMRKDGSLKTMLARYGISDWKK